MKEERRKKKFQGEVEEEMAENLVRAEIQDFRSGSEAAMKNRVESFWSLRTREVLVVVTENQYPEDSGGVGTSSIETIEEGRIWDL